MKEDALRSGIREKREILKSLRRDKKQGHKVDYLIEQTQGELAELRKQVPRRHDLSFLGLVLLNAALVFFIVSDGFVQWVRDVAGEEIQRSHPIAAKINEQAPVAFVILLGVFLLTVFLIQWRLRRRLAKRFNSLVILIELAALAALCISQDVVREAIGL
ncbi:MAG: hypothetical protein ACYTHN_02715 [Planctomycetota bacterium]|jgi:cytochrome bd-type quinol oxidase subunit 2